MKIAIVIFSSLIIDNRVLRQIEQLRRRHDVRVIAENPAPKDLWGAVHRALPPSETWLGNRTRAVRRRAGIVAGMGVRDWLCRQTRASRITLRELRNYQPDLILCNELHPLPACREYHRRAGCPVIVDLHEFYPADTVPSPSVQKYDIPNSTWTLKDAAQWVACGTTINEMIAQRYEEDFGLKCEVIYNAALIANPPVFRPAIPEAIHLVHVGMYQPTRRPEAMLEGVIQAGDPWRLHLYLAGDQKGIEGFRKRCAAESGGRVIVHETVPSNAVEAAITGYDLGISMTPSLNWNWLMGSPNKYFSYLAAGLGMVLGPKPWKLMMNEKWGVAEMTGGFEPEDLAATLRGLTVERVNELKRKAVEAAKHLNGAVEGEKLLALCERIAGAAVPKN